MALWRRVDAALIRFVLAHPTRAGFFVSTFLTVFAVAFAVIPGGPWATDGAVLWAVNVLVLFAAWLSIALAFAARYRSDRIVSEFTRRLSGLA